METKMTKLPPVMKEGSWERDVTFSSFEYKGEKITIDTEDKYLYWNKRYLNSNSEEVRWFIENNFYNLALLAIALEDFLYITHRADDSIFNK